MAFWKGPKADTKKLTDEEIVQRILGGEQQLMELLYDRYSTKIFHKCLSLIRDREAAKDCTHDIMVKVFLNLANFKGRSAFSLWVHSISYNYCMDYLQKQKRLNFSDYTETEYETVANYDDELAEKVLHEVQLSQLEAVFEYLNPDDKLLLMMRYQDEMSVRDISESLRIGESAVKMRLKRSRDRLADLLERYQKNNPK